MLDKTKEQKRINRQRAVASVLWFSIAGCFIGISILLKLPVFGFMFTAGIIVGVIACLPLLRMMLRGDRELKWQRVKTWKKIVAAVSVSIGVILIWLAISLPASGIIADFFSVGAFLGLSVGEVIIIAGALWVGVSALAYLISVFRTPLQAQQNVVSAQAAEVPQFLVAGPKVADPHQPPFHPELPTTAAFENQPEVRASDHCLLSGKVTAFTQANDEQEQHELTVATWNVDGGQTNESTGFAPVFDIRNANYSAEARSGVRGPEHQAARYQRIADKLRRFVGRQTPDFICLQELGQQGADDPVLLEVIRSTLGEDEHTQWGCAYRNDCLTIFNQQEYCFREFDEDAENEEKDCLFYRGGHVAVFEKVGSEGSAEPVTVEVSNGHSLFSLDPTKHEEGISRRTTPKNNHTIQIVACDFNCPSPGGEITALVPPSMTPDGRQSASSIDAIYCGFMQKNDRGIARRACVRVKTATINTETGESYDSNLLRQSLRDNPLLSQDKILGRLRLTMCVTDDDRVQLAELLRYESSLKKRLGDGVVCCRLAIELLGREELGMMVTRQLYDQIPQKFNHVQQGLGRNATYHIFVSSLDEFQKLYGVLMTLPPVADVPVAPAAPRSAVSSLAAPPRRLSVASSGSNASAGNLDELGSEQSFESH